VAGTTVTRGLRSYRHLLADPPVRSLVAWSLLARAPIGMAALAEVLLVRGSGRSYADAGIVSAAGAIAVAFGAPVGGRLVDRRRPALVLACYGTAYTAALLLLVLLAQEHAALFLLALAAAAAGATQPPVAPTVRTMWSVIVTADLHAAAFALEATLQEVFFVAGPLLVGVLTGLVSSSAGVLGAAVIGAVGVTGFIMSPAVRTLRREPHPGHGSRLAALGPSLVRRIVVFTACYGITFGAVEVAMPAFAEQHGGRSLAGICLAAWSAGSLAGGLLAAGHRPSDPRRRLRVVSALFAALLLPLLAAGSLPVMTVLMFTAGLPIAPSFALTYGMVQRAAAPGTRAEVFGWLTTAVVIGVAIGTAAGGGLITHTGFRASILLGICGCVAATAVAALPYRDVQQA